MQIMQVPAAREGSIEYLLHHEEGSNRYYLFSKENNAGHFHTTIPHRAIGVVYHPERERFGNYVPSLLAQRYDAFIFIDHTKALHPLALHPIEGKLPETYPFGV